MSLISVLASFFLSELESDPDRTFHSCSFPPVLPDVKPVSKLLWLCLLYESNIFSPSLCHSILCPRRYVAAITFLDFHCYYNRDNYALIILSFFYKFWPLNPFSCISNFMCNFFRKKLLILSPELSFYSLVIIDTASVSIWNITWIVKEEIRVLKNWSKILGIQLISEIFMNLS